MVGKRLTACAASMLLAMGWSSMAAAADQAEQYWTIDQYFNNHAENRDKAPAFAEVVRQDAVKTTFKHSTGKTRIAVVYPGLQASDYWRRSVSSLEKRLVELGVPYSLDSHFSKPHIEVSLQAQQLMQALSKDPDYLIFTLDAMRHRSMIERIIAKGRPKLILQNITTPVKAWGEIQPYLYVGFDHVIGSRLLADEYIRRTGGKGKYAVIFWSEGYISTMRGHSFIDYLGDHSDLSLANSFYTDTSRASAKKAALAALQANPDLKFIYACTTDLALGAIEALEETGMIGKVMVNGWGGGSSELEALAQGKLNFTVMRMNDDNGVAMAEAIRLDLSGQGDQVPTIYSGDFELITESKSPAEIQALKQRAFRYSGN